jgi:hexulose-6-phosphate isomerase
MFDIAILQGRLTPDPEGKFQFFPKAWGREFPIAREMGFDGIEWLIHTKNMVSWPVNPVFAYDFAGRLRAAESVGVPVTSVCADWFMDVEPWEGDPDNHRASLRQVIKAAALLKNRLILVPLLERNAVHDPFRQVAVVQVLRSLTDALVTHDVRIAFETELPAKELGKFVDAFGSDRFGVYYDTGNCTSYGFDCPADIRQLGRRVFGVHVKDRKVGSAQSVSYGQGDTDFVGVLRALRAVSWQGTLVMQAYRGEDYLDDARRQRAFLIEKQKEAFG